MSKHIDFFLDNVKSIVCQFAFFGDSVYSYNTLIATMIIQMMALLNI